MHNNDNGTWAKIKEMEELPHILASFRSKGNKIVHCHGVFDLLHIGHIRYFNQARTFGDVLIVTVTPDRYVDKGPNRPAFEEALRAEAIASLDCVDYVAVNKWPTAEETLQIIKPDIYVKGSDFNGAASDITGKLAKEEHVVKEIGAEIAFTKDIVFSSTNLINRFFSSFPDEVQEYLNIFRTRYNFEDIISLLDRMASLKVLIIGDTILDDYHYCHTIGSSSKDPVLALQYDSNDLFAGGVLAVANHAANFVENVRLVTVLGEKDRHEDFIRSKLHANISPFFITQDGAPTLIKRRFVEGYSLNKVFEVYIMDDSGVSAEKDSQLCDWLKHEISEYDLVIAADFGHGAITERARDTLTGNSPFLAVNTQANAGNRGFHTVTRYSRADYVSIADHEIRLETRDLKGKIGPMVEKISTRLDCTNFVVTRGKQGCLIRSKNEALVEVPAFAQKVVDRIGAGDAFFAVTALAAYLDASPELIGFLGNVVGALAVNILGNKNSIDKMEVTKYITSLLK
ncbi:MAG: adenylyltransferase/cytidyltransferase family protein [Desulfobacterales bacterium]|nr:adenylyltransferase/cytidyltransferase family protein [Desulfobacterales bacterium]